jgi:hypothetical protein
MHLLLSSLKLDCTFVTRGDLSHGILLVAHVNGSARQSSAMVPVQLSALLIPPHVHRAANMHQPGLQVVAPDPRSAAGPPAGGDSMVGTLQHLR